MSRVGESSQPDSSRDSLHFCIAIEVLESSGQPEFKQKIVLHGLATTPRSSSERLEGGDAMQQSELHCSSVEMRLMGASS